MCVLTFEASETASLRSFCPSGKKYFKGKNLLFLSALSMFMFKEGRLYFNVIIIIIISLCMCRKVFLLERKRESIVTW